MIKTNSDKPPLDAHIYDPDVTNSCLVCGHRTNLVGNAPDCSYYIQECSVCGQVHHFYDAAGPEPS